MIKLSEYKKTFEKDYTKLTNQDLLVIINKLVPLIEKLNKDMLELFDTDEYLAGKYIEIMKVLNSRI